MLGSGRTTAIAIAGAMAMLGIFLLWNSGALIRVNSQEVAYFRSPAFFPRVCLVLFSGFALISVIGELRQKNEYNIVLGPYFHLALIVAYALILPILGYLISSIAFLFVAIIVRGTNLITSAVLAAVLGGALYLLFDFALDVWFPKSALSSIFGG